jgi:mannose/fructose-specific phosphotransferase system component IIA
VTRAIIVTHKSLGQALMNAVEGMLGPQQDFEILSNEGLSLEQITDAVERLLTDSPTLLFVDFCGGSPYVACKSLRDRHPECALVSGVNLPMLISFFTKRDKLSYTELAGTVETDGHRGIQLILA